MAQPSPQACSTDNPIGSTADSLPAHISANPSVRTVALKLPPRYSKLVDLGPGPEIRDWKNLQVATGIEIFLCDPYAA